MKTTNTLDKVFILEQHDINKMIRVMDRLYSGDRMNYEDRREQAKIIHSVIDSAVELEYPFK